MPPTTLTPTYDTGATTKPSLTVYVPPDRQVYDGQLAERLPDTGLNMPFVADILSAMLAHTRCSRHLYRSVATRSGNPVLKAKYEQFGQDVEQAATLLEGLVTTMGGDPMYVSPAARAVEGADTKQLEATFLLAGSVDPMTQEMVMLDGALLAESMASANWSTLIHMAGALPDGALKQAAVDVAAQAAPVCNQHLMWGRQTKAELTTLQASSRMMAAAGTKPDDMLDVIKGWLS